LDTSLARILEPRAPRPDLRLQAVRKLAQEGIRVGVNCAPVLPGITDAPADLEALVRAAADAGARSVWAAPLFLKPCAARVFLPFVKENFPHLATVYEERYANRAFAPAAYGRRITTMMKTYRKKYQLGDRDRSRNPNPTPASKEDSGQLSLF